VGLPNSCTIVELGLDEIPLTSGGDSPMFHSPTIEVSPFHVIFNLNKILITTCFEKCGYGKATFHTIVLRPRLKELLEFFLHNSTSIFGPKLNVTISIIIWIKSSTKHKSLYMFLQCLIEHFTCKICISYWINLTSQFSIRTLTLFFLHFLTLTLATRCS